MTKQKTDEGRQFKAHSTMRASKKNHIEPATKTAGTSSGSYKPAYNAIANKMCAMGATFADLAEAFGATIDTIQRWMADHKRFSEACMRGKEAADACVERRLFERATGYTVEVEKPVFHQGRMHLVTYRQHVPADASAAKFWLLNCCSNSWPKRPEGEHPLKELARQLAGTVLRPRDPEQLQDKKQE